MVGHRKLGGYLVAFCIVVAAAWAIFAAIASLSGQLPEINSISDYQPKLVTTVLAADQMPIGEFANEKRELARLDEIPKALVQAIIAAEDQHFFSHKGLDYWGILNAVTEKLLGERETLRGASTLTQQLAKSFIIDQQGFEKGTERSLSRKLKELLLAKRLEGRLTKAEILWLYLNQIYLGHGAYGVQAAAKTYFGKNVADLNLAESALLAGLPQAPSRFSPFLNLEAAKKRQRYVLDRILDEGWISKKEYVEANSAPINLNWSRLEEPLLNLAPYANEEIRRYLIEKYGEKMLYEGGLQIESTIDLERQLLAQKQLAQGMQEADQRQGYRGPLGHLKKSQSTAQLFAMLKKDPLGSRLLLGKQKIAVVQKIDQLGFVTVESAQGRQKFRNEINFRFRPGDTVLISDKGIDQEPLMEGALFAFSIESGYTEALVGGYSYERSEFNRVFQACRQPGSAFKPIVYATAIATKNYTPATMIADVPLTYRNEDEGRSWKPKNMNHSYRGEVTCREAVMNSMNVPAILTMQDVGFAVFGEWAKKLGIETPLKRELGTAIGSSCVIPWQLGQAFSVFANSGERVTPFLIKRILTKDGRILEDHRVPTDPWQSRQERLDALVRSLDMPKTQVMDHKDAYLTHYLLTQVTTNGTAARASSLGMPLAGKTGTTDDNYDTWFVGYSPSLLALVWVGSDKMDIPLGPYEQGGRTALPIWMEFMKGALQNLNEEPMAAPNGICFARVDSETGAIADPNSAKTFRAPFKCGSEPKSVVAAGSVKLEEALTTPGGL